ncbi:MAG: GrpB family protein [Candidatus Obscuribacterales bacterium]|nr:GrpB family protein [Candidatus Obscuribacterales bacterium]
MNITPDDDPFVVIDYDPSWPDLYKQEEKRLNDTLGTSIIDIQHIGSTAVRGLAAKPEIDIQISVDNLAEVENHIQQLETLGYQRKLPDANIPNFFFCKNASDGEPAYHLHIVEEGSDEQSKQVIFRDYLLDNYRGIQEYEALKRAMAEKFPNDRSAYVDAKTAFITLALALYKT